MKKRLWLLCVLSLSMAAWATSSFGVAVLSTSVTAGEPLTPGEQFDVQVAVTSNDTGSAPIAAAIRIHYATSSVTLISTAAGDLGPVLTGSVEEGDSDQFTDILTLGDYENVDMTPVCFTVTFEVNESPVYDFDIWAEDDPQNDTLVTISFETIDHTYNNSETMGLLPASPTNTPTSTPTSTPTPVNIDGELCSPAWEFNDPGNFQGWTSNAHVSGPAVTGGAYVATTVGTDPALYSPIRLGITADYQKQIEIRMRATQGTLLDLFFRNTTQPGFAGARKVRMAIPDNSNFVTYKIDMNGIAAWSGIIEQLRLDPTNASGASVEVDYIRVCLPMCVMAPRFEFNDTGNEEGWVCSAAVTNFEAVSGFLNGLTTGSPVTMSSPVLARPADAMNQTGVQLRLKMTAGSTFGIYFKVVGQPGFVGGISVPVKDNTNFVNYFVDLSASGTYTGKIERYQVRPVCPAGTTIQLDYFRVCMPIMNYEPSWKFESNGDDEGWVSNNTGTLAVDGGKLSATSTSADPNLLSPISLVDSRFARFFVLDMSTSAGNSVDIFHQPVGGAFTAATLTRLPMGPLSRQNVYLADLAQVQDYAAKDVRRFRVDPTNASGASFNIESMGMLDEVMRTRCIGEFNQDGNSDGWIGNAHLGPVTVSNGKMQATSTGADPYFINPGDLRLNADNIESIVIRMKVSAGTIGDLFYKRDGDGGFAASRRIRFDITNNSDFVTYNLDVTTDANWNGSVTSLRFDPTNASGANIEIDSIRAFGPSQFGNPEWRWDMTGNMQAWTSAGTVGSTSVADGSLTTVSNGNDPILYTPVNLNINTATQKWVVVRMKSDKAGSIALFYRTSGQGFSAARRKVLPIDATSDFNIYQIYMGNDPNWTGTVFALRFDPINASAATVDMDYFLVP